MAQSANNLTAVFTDTANAIRQKAGKVDAISPRDFADEILALPTGGGSSNPVVKGDVIFMSGHRYKVLQANQDNTDVELLLLDDYMGSVFNDNEHAPVEEVSSTSTGDGSTDTFTFNPSLWGDEYSLSRVTVGGEEVEFTQSLNPLRAILTSAPAEGAEVILYRNKYIYDIYKDSALDNKMTEFYNSLDEDIQNAIIEQERVQSEYNIKAAEGEEDFTFIGFGMSYRVKKLTERLIGNRKCYILGIEDLISYFEGNSATGAATNTLIFECADRISADIWLTSCAAGDYSPDLRPIGYGGRNGTPANSGYYEGDHNIARPAFHLNLSEVSYINVD